MSHLRAVGAVFLSAVVVAKELGSRIWLPERAGRNEQKVPPYSRFQVQSAEASTGLQPPYGASGKRVRRPHCARRNFHLEGVGPDGGGASMTVAMVT